MAKAKNPTAPAAQTPFSFAGLMAGVVNVLTATAETVEAARAKASAILTGATDHALAQFVAAFKGAPCITGETFDNECKEPLRKALEAQVKAGTRKESSINPMIGKVKTATIAITHGILPLPSGENLDTFRTRVLPLITGVPNKAGVVMYAPKNKGGRKTGKPNKADTKPGKVATISRDGALAMLANNDAADMAVLAWASSPAGLPHLRALAAVYMPK